MKQLTKTACTAMLCLLLCFNSQAQPPDTSTVDKLLHYILQPLDKLQVSTSFLEEWGAPMLPMVT
jgi:hypothetical protein